MAGEASTLPKTEAPDSIGVYRRVVHASIDRIWENVLDWEHLPWLHRGSFADIRLLSHDVEGWRAVVTLSAEFGGAEQEIEVALEREHLRYTTRTLEGAGEGTEIVTTLEPRDDENTCIYVDFRVPGVAPRQTKAVAESFMRLYARLWDEDEGMMERREEVLARGACEQRPAVALDDSREPVPLGQATALHERVPFLIDVAGQRYRIIGIDGELVAHATVCPHRGGPLEMASIDDDCVVCPWHGYRFNARTGRSADGRLLRLDTAPRIEVDSDTGETYLRW